MVTIKTKLTTKKIPAHLIIKKFASVSSLITVSLLTQTNKQTNTFLIIYLFIHVFLALATGILICVVL